MNYNFTRLDKSLIPRATLLNLIIFTVCSVYLASEVYYLIKLLPTNRADFTVYHQASVKVLSGQIPFRDFRLEYPVFALIPILVPGIFNLIFHSSFESYCVLFTLQNVFYAGASALMLTKIELPYQNSGEHLLWFTLLCLFSLPIFLFRYDSFPVFLTVCIIWAISQRPLLTGAILVLAIGAKLYPLIFAPVLFFYYLINNDYKKLRLFVIGGLATLLMTLAITLPFTGLSFFDFLKYHGQRGIQLESVASGLILLLHQFDLVGVTLTNNFGSYNIETPASEAILHFISVVTPIAFLLLVSFIFWVFRTEKRAVGAISTNSAIHAFTLLLLAFLLLNKVMSPQYMIWLFPFVPFLKNTTRIKFIVILMLTITIYPGWYYYLTLFEPITVVMLNMRNLLLIWMFADVLVELLRMTNITRSTV